MLAIFVALFSSSFQYTYTCIQRQTEESQIPKTHNAIFTRINCMEKPHMHGIIVMTLHYVFDTVVEAKSDPNDAFTIAFL